MGLLTPIYSQTRLLALALSDIEAEQIKQERERQKRDREKSLLTVAFSMFLCVVKMLPSQLLETTHPLSLV